MSKIIKVSLTLFLSAHFVFGHLYINRAYCAKPSAEEDLLHLKKEIKKTKEALKKQEKKESSVMLKLNSLDKELDLIKKELDIYEYNLIQNKKKINTTKALMQELEGQINAGLTRLKGRLRAVYKSGGIGFLKLLFSSRSINEILRSTTMMKYIARYDTKLINKLKKDHDLHLQNKKDLEGYQTRVNKYQSYAMKRKADLLEQQAKRQVLLDLIRKDKTRQVSLLKEMEKRSEELTNLLLKEGWSGSSDFERSKGRLIWPVKGRLSAQFGFHYDSALDRKILNNGVRIQAPIGTDIVSIAKGRVIFADWFCGYGKLIIIDHGEGYNSIYAHTSELFAKEGKFVREGERVAAVGDTDSIRGPELYFEIRYKGKPIDPVKWLRDR